MKFIYAIILLFSTALTNASTSSDIWYIRTDSGQINLNVELYLSSSCKYCQKADKFFHELEKKEPWLLVKRYVINQDKSALQRFYDRMQQQNLNNFAVPAIYFCGSRWTGFNDDNSSQKSLLYALNFCLNKIKDNGELSSADIKVLNNWGIASQFSIGKSISDSALKVVFITSLVESFNPCSLFCFALFLAFLWLYPTKKWEQFGVGITFIFTFCFIHYIHQFHADFYYKISNNLKYGAIIVGFLLLRMVFKSYRNIIQNKVLKFEIFDFITLIFAVVIVEVFQQTCIFNISLVIEQWLLEQSLSPFSRLFYQLFYQFLYLLPAMMVLLFFLIYGRKQFFNRHMQKLKIIASIVLICMAIILIFYPLLLSNAIICIAVLALSLLSGMYLSKFVAKG